MLTCDVGTPDADGCADTDGASEGALVGQIETLVQIIVSLTVVTINGLQVRGQKITHLGCSDGELDGFRLGTAEG